MALVWRLRVEGVSSGGGFVSCGLISYNPRIDCLAGGSACVYLWEDVMISRYRLFARVALGCGVALMAALGARAEAPEGFTPLFNGTDLSGWTGDPALWSVDDGKIVGSTEGVKLPHNTFLYTDKDYPT